MNEKPRFKIKDGNIIRINPDGTTTSRPLTDEERRRLEEARAAKVKAQQNESKATLDEEAARRRAEQVSLAKNQAEAADMIGVTEKSVRQSSTQRADNAKSQKEKNIKSRRKKRMRVSGGIVAFVILMTAVVGVSVKQIKENERNADAENKQNSFTYYDSGNESDSLEDIPQNNETDPFIEEPKITFEVSQIANTEISKGDLILVNYEYAYTEDPAISLKNADKDRTGNDEIGKLRVTSADVNMQSEAFDALEAMVRGLKSETGNSELKINSGHRTYENQVSIMDSYISTYGEDYAKAYVANPGYSEHHTGLACDLTFYSLADKVSVPIPDHEFGQWIVENCIHYGFIRRYPEGKTEITKISYEPWHFRYVGIPHAYAMNSLGGYCLEEYIEYLKDYTADGKMLYVYPNGTIEAFTLEEIDTEKELSGGWFIYYTPKSDGEMTDVKLLTGEKFTSIEISGNNVDGFITTVTVAE